MLELQSTPKRWMQIKPFLFFTVVLLVKSWLAWFVIFDDGPSWTLIFKELPFIWIFFCLIEWFATKRKIPIYLTVNLVLTGILFAVIMYYKYYGVIVTYKALDQVNQVTAVKNSVFSLLDPYFLFIFIDVIVLAIWLYRSNNAKKWRSKHSGRVRKSTVTTVFVLSLIVCMFNILPNRASMNELVKAEQMGILNYEAYTILSAAKKPDMVPHTEITQASINEIKKVKTVNEPKLQGIAKEKNLIIIQLESFQNFLLGLEVDGQEVTPNMNKLMNESLYFPKFYQQVGSGNTSDAEFVVNSSMYIPRTGAASQMYAMKELPSLPKLLKASGYQSATFHTNVVEFWNRKELYEALSFDHYYDAEYFGDEDQIFFGASDEVLYRKSMTKLKDMANSGQPFYAHVLSMTAHHPYTTPPEKDKIVLPEAYQKTMVGDYLRAQSYADAALGEFITELKQSGIWDNSLIVIYGDHLGLPLYSLDQHEKDLMAEIHGREYGYADMINIPLLILGEGIEPEVSSHTGGQVDLLPTIANLLGISLEEQIHFGQDMVNQSSNLLPERYYLPSGSYVNDTTLFVSGSGYEDGEEHLLKQQSIDALNSSNEEYERALQLLNLSDSYVEQLPERQP
ncbi:Phosphoglycerol transferase MdoB [Paenibacillus aquistagni]|uniref:Phosphoglycerol transferase MdoB n=2 Tax=Paenibacillus aquistagni TaxID=1852522 RepID=A0A1X7I8Q7_9BACL|nr:Phosphoglycerol transferase MdoB [Paenibacillus aquistagni]